jgi:glycosyltransferase involved in cell wall biosynthesis
MNVFPAISVVIRTRDSARTLERVILGLGCAAGDEVIVVDSGSRDATLDIARKHGAIIVPAPGLFNYSKSLNLGFAAAKNPWVLVISSHSIPVAPGFLEVHRREIAQFPDDVVVGYAPSTVTGKKNPQLGGQICFYTQDDFQRVCWLLVGNGNTVYRLGAWQKCPFDEKIQTEEDKLWLKEITGRGYRFAYLPEPCACARYRGSLSYMFRKGFNDARASRRTFPKPMRMIHLAGALKSTVLMCLRRQVDAATSLRLMAATLGQFFGSHQKYKNSVANEGNRNKITQNHS